MPRNPKPYPKDGWFCTSIGGVQHQKLCRLGEGTRKAELALARLIVLRDDARKAGLLHKPPSPGIAAAVNAQPLPAQAPHVPPAYLAGPTSATVARVYDDFLRVKQVECAEDTYLWYRDKLDPFFERYADRPVASITYEEGLEYKTWLRREKPRLKGKGLANTTVNHHLRAAKTLLGWASKPSRRATYGLSVNPWEEIKSLEGKRRERLLTEEEFRHLLEQCTDGNVSGGARDFREQLLVLRHTTLRPGELRKLRWEYVRWEQHIIVFPPEVIKTRRRREVTMGGRQALHPKGTRDKLCSRIPEHLKVVTSRRSQGWRVSPLRRPRSASNRTSSTVWRNTSSTRSTAPTACPGARGSPSWRTFPFRSARRSPGP